MITAVQSYTNFNGLKNINAARSLKRTVVKNAAPKGLTQSPVRALTDKEKSDYLKMAAGVLVGTSALTCLTDFCNGCSIGSNMI